MSISPRLLNACATRPPKRVPARWVPRRLRVRSGPDGRRLLPRASSNYMKATRFNTHSANGTGKAPDRDMALFATALALALAMLSLFAVLALASVMPLGDVAPFSAIPMLLFVTSGVFFTNWLHGEAHEAAVEEAAHRSSIRPPTRGRAVSELAQPRRQRESRTTARR